MRKILVFIMVAILAFSMTACVQTSQTDSEKDVNNQSEIQKEADETPVESEQNESTSTNTSVDFDALKAVENSDDFELKITSVECVEGLFDNGSPVIDMSGEDGIALTIENKTNMTIQDFKVLILCTDENGSGRDLATLQSINTTILPAGSSVVSYSNYVKVMGSSVADLATGSSKEYVIQCDLENIKNVNAIVYSYVDGRGNEVVNENYENWLPHTVEVSTY